MPASGAAPRSDLHVAAHDSGGGADSFGVATLAACGSQRGRRRRSGGTRGRGRRLEADGRILGMVGGRGRDGDNGCHEGRVETGAAGEWWQPPRLWC
jgi:hypothetical protein